MLSLKTTVHLLQRSVHGCWDGTVGYVGLGDSRNDAWEMLFGAVTPANTSSESHFTHRSVGHTSRIPSAHRYSCRIHIFNKMHLDLYLTLKNIQDVQKISVHLMITTQKITSNVQSVPRQSPDIIDTPG
jgi:hypothetical protein